MTYARALPRLGAKLYRLQHGGGTAGLAGWAHHLDSGFAMIDGDDLDLFLDGSAVIIDADSDGFADRLGDATAAPARPGIWSAEIDGKGGVAKFSGTWSAVRR